MFRISHKSKGLQLITKAANAIRKNDWALSRIDPAGLRYVTTISVRGHWFISALCFVELVYRAYYGPAKFGAYAVLLSMLIGFNGYLHYRLRSNRPVTWHWLLALYSLDLFLVSVGVAISNGFSHDFFHLFYYPALATFAAIFTSFRLSLAWVTMASFVYIALSLTVGDGLDTDARDEKTLLARIAIMYAVVATVNLASRFERMRWERAVERERALVRERVELSQAIHYTAAQSTYMIGLGIDTAKALAGNANPELTATLEETSRLSRSTIWELRHTISLGGIYEGRELGRALRSHATSFTNVTTVPAEMAQTGIEPQLTIKARSVLFSIAHNALTNAYRHAEASRVTIALDFGDEGIRLTVSDNGIGLPEDYAELGNGFSNMNKAAERLGGHLVVERRGAMGGASVTCVIPSELG